MGLNFSRASESLRQLEKLAIGLLIAATVHGFNRKLLSSRNIMTRFDMHLLPVGVIKTR